MDERILICFSYGFCIIESVHEPISHEAMYLNLNRMVNPNGARGEHDRVVPATHSMRDTLTGYRGDMG
jgi:hypothetical protein